MGWIGSLLLLTVLAVPTTAAAQRVALVIGNAAYEHATPLRNPHNDAQAMAAALQRLGFDTGDGPVLDTTGDGLRAAVRLFRDRSRGAEIALVFFAGHAIQVNNVNYLVPVDGALHDPGDVAVETLGLDAVLAQMRGSVNLMILDACRDNPFGARLAAASQQLGRSLATGRGLARIDGRTLAGGSLVAMAAAANAVADDGGGAANSPYTAALLQHLETPGLPVSLMFRRVRETVELRSNGQQQPEAIDRLPARPIYLAPSAAEPVAVAQAESRGFQIVPEAASPPAPGPAPVPPGPIAPAAPAVGLTAKQMATLLLQLGLSVALEGDDRGGTKVYVGDDPDLPASELHVDLFDCDARGVCRDALVWAWFTPQYGDPLLELNEWNAAHRWTRTYLDDDDDVRLEIDFRDVSSEGMAWLLETYLDQLAELAEQFGAY